MSETSREALWVLRAQSGDREAFELLLRSVQPPLLRFIGALVGPAEADDVLQETMMRVYRKLGQLTTPQLFRPWAFRIAKRVGLRHMKYASRWLDDPGEATSLDDMPAPDALHMTESLDQLLREGQVSPASRAVLLLHFQEGLTLSEVAAALDLPVGTVKSRLAYGLSLLRKNLNEPRSLQ